VGAEPHAPSSTCRKRSASDPGQRAERDPRAARLTVVARRHHLDGQLALRLPRPARRTRRRGLAARGPHSSCSPTSAPRSSG
jgi:hypothetical protein